MTTMTREDTGEFLPVRVLDGHQPASSNDYMADWDAIERAAAAEFAAWLEGQWAQIEAETRAAADEQLHQHRQVRVGIAERLKDTVNLPPGFEEIAPAWAELPDEINKSSRHEPPAEPDPVQAYFDADDPDEMPGRTVVLTPTDHPLAQAYARTAHHLEQTQGWTPDPADYGPHPTPTGPPSENPYCMRCGKHLGKPFHETNEHDEAANNSAPVLPNRGQVAPTERPGAGRSPEAAYHRGAGIAGPRNPVARRVDGLLARVETWWRAKQAQRDQRMGVGE